MPKGEFRRTSHLKVLLARRASASPQT